MATRTATTLRTKQPRDGLQPLWSSRSHVSTFVRCLHLLDLDLREDWPGIDEATLTPTVAKQNLQNKLRAIEWSLYRLFELYNHEETRDKLRPFFPPSSPLQSVNLRAALYRCLAELKKNGILGAQFQLRKTMLDDCKGEKFEELIAGFALIVLRKVAKGKNSLIVENNEMLKDDQILPLVLAHRISLQEKIDQRSVSEKNLEVFLTRSKEARAALALRKQEAEAKFTKPNLVLQHEIKSLVNANWIGNHAWADLILKGLPPSPAYQGNQLQLSEHKQPASNSKDSVQALVDQLDANINKHKRRLAEWQVIAKDLKGKQSATKDERTPVHKQATPNLAGPSRFSAHKQLKVSSVQAHNGPTPALVPEYQAILDALKGELSTKKSSQAKEGAKGTNSKPQFRTEPRQASGRAKLKENTHGLHHISEGHSSNPVAQRSEQSTRSKFDNLSPENLKMSRTADEIFADTGTSTKEDPQTSATIVEELGTDVIPSDMQEDGLHEVCMSDTSPVSTLPDEMTSTAWAHDLQNSTALGQLSSPVKVSESLPLQAFNINETIESPTSPSKEWMSLMDRTRASMSTFGTQSHTSKSTPNKDFAKQQQQQPENADNVHELHKTEDVPTTLVGRTRQSMSLHASTATKATNRRKSQRMSQIFPVNQFETPGRPRARLSEFGPSSESSTPREKLFEEAADYESVFKSRPRIAMSPAMSPDRSGIGFDSILEQDMDGLQLASDDEYD